jgi:signal transduction histidine kinase
MKSLRWRLAAWFGISALLLLTAFFGVTYHLLHSELHEKNWQRNYPDHPDWRLHGSYSEAEIADIMGEFVESALLYGFPLALIAVIIGFVLSQKSLRPIASLNAQLQSIHAPDLSRRIELSEVDAEFRGLVNHLNELLGRVDHAYTDMSEYAAKVTHELRTPLSILRLKVEQAGDRIAPELGEQLQTELLQLQHVVDQSLLIAKAEQGRMQLDAVRFDLAQLVADVAEDFALLAQEDQRTVQLDSPQSAIVMANPKHIRQILHNLFTNALKHGQGRIRVRVSRRPGKLVLLIANALRACPVAQETPGLGLRVVKTLLGLQPELKCRCRAGRRHYAVQLVFPSPPPRVR